MGAKVLAVNCIFWGNIGQAADDRAQLLGDGGTTIRHSLIQDNSRWRGSGNLDGNPRFAGELRLASTSPCIDGGDNLADFDPSDPEESTRPTTDLAGEPRFIGGNLDGTAVIDMGAYEYQGN